jgi:2-polyprenyl-6-methoxyphenol hydroxylase-like FAD-dependent oxidoreductase
VDLADALHPGLVARAGRDPESARILASPLLFESIKNAEPLNRLPERFAVVGDAACAFKPVDGQGMTAAAMTSLVLRRSLGQQRPDRDLTGFAKRFQRRVAKVDAGAWLLATREDLRFATAEGPRPGRLTRLTYRYADRVLETANGNCSAPGSCCPS